MNKFLFYFLLIAVLVAGAFFRVNHINDESLWLDEGITYYNSSSDSFSGVWDKTAKLDQSPPGYYFITHTYLNLFGENEFGFRLISVVFGVLSILFLYLLCSEIFDKETGLYAAALLAVNSFHIGFSIESRMYVLLSLFSLIGFWSLYKALKHETRGYFWWILFSLSSIAGLYTHNFYAFVLLAFAAIFLLHIFTVEKKIGKLLMGILSAIIVVIAYLPWLPSFLAQLSVTRYWMAENSIMDIKEYFLDFTGQNAILLLVFIFLSIIALAWSIFAGKSERYKTDLMGSLSLFIFIIFAFSAPLFYSLKFEPILKIRYVVYIVPIFMAIVAFGLRGLQKYTVIIPICIILLISYFSYPLKGSAYPVEIGEDFRGLVEIIDKNPAPLVVHSPSITHVINFYNKGSFKIWPFPYSDNLNEYNIDENSKKKFFDLIRKFDSFYLAVTHSHENPYGLLKVWAESNCSENNQFELSGIELIYFSECSY